MRKFLGFLDISPYLSFSHSFSLFCKDVYKRQVSELFKQLSDPTRVRLFWLLCHCEECVLNLSAMMKMTSPAISHHLRELRNKDLVSSRRVGKEVYYKSANTEQSVLLHKMIERILMITCPEHKE